MPNGVWYSKLKSKISYPEEGNAECFQLEDGSFWFKHRNAAIIELIMRFSPKSVFWDIGGGNGYVAKGIQDAGLDSVLIEPGEIGCINARKRGLENVVCSTLQDAKLPESAISSCGLFDVLEHIEDDKAFLEMLHKSMAKDGLVYLTVPALQALWSREDEIAGHYRRYSTKSISDVFEKAGFSVLYVSYFFKPLIIPIFLFRSLPKLLGFKGDAGGAEKFKKEHGADSSKSISKSIMEWLLKGEIETVKKLQTNILGTSCILVARKKQ